MANAHSAGRIHKKESTIEMRTIFRKGGTQIESDIEQIFTPLLMAKWTQLAILVAGSGGSNCLETEPKLPWYRTHTLTHRTHTHTHFLPFGNGLSTCRYIFSTSFGPSSACAAAV